MKKLMSLLVIMIGSAQVVAVEKKAVTAAPASAAPQKKSWRAMPVNSFGSLTITIEADKETPGNYYYVLKGDLSKSADFKQLLDQMAQEVKEVAQASGKKGASKLQLQKMQGLPLGAVGSFKLSGDKKAQQAAVEKIQAALNKDLKGGGMKFQFSGISVYQSHEHPAVVQVSFQLRRISNEYDDWSAVAGVQDGDTSNIALPIKLFTSQRELFKDDTNRKIEALFSFEDFTTRPSYLFPKKSS